MELIIKYLLQILRDQAELKALILQADNGAASMDNTFLLTEDVMRILKICERKVRELRKNKLLPFTKIGKTPYFSKAAIYNLLNKK